MAESSSPSPSNNMLRNIITGVITTVAGAAAVYFLGFKGGFGEKKNSEADYLVMKEATTKAWKNYVTIDNIYYKNLLSLNKDQQLLSDLDKYKNEVFKEGAKFKKDAENILKDKDIDRAFISMIERRLERDKEAEEAISFWFDRLNEIKRSNDGPEEKQARVIKETESYQAKGTGILERTLNEVEDLAKTLSERYGQQFNLNDFQAYVDYKNGKFNPNNNNNTNNSNNTQNNIGGVDANQTNNQTNYNNNNYNKQDNYNTNDNYDYGNSTSFNAKSFVGEWQTNAGYMYLDGNGGMSWDWTNGQITDGTWKFYNNQIYQYPTQYYGAGSIWVFNVSNVTRNSFTMQLVNSNVVYYATRVNDEGY